MNVRQHAEAAISRIATAIGEPARARMLYCLMDGHARTSTELSVVAEVSPSTARGHLSRLKTGRLGDAGRRGGGAGGEGVCGAGPRHRRDADAAAQVRVRVPGLERAEAACGRSAGRGDPEGCAEAAMGG